MSSTAKEPIYIIVPVHNRKNTTLVCLENLNKLGDLQRYHVVVVDDGSTDGTTQAINTFYPDVNVIPGNGNLWWTGAISKGMQYAYEQGAEYFIWLNDDTIPSRGAIQLLVQICRGNPRKIVSAQCYASSDLTIPTYGGQRRQRLATQPVYAIQNETVQCDAIDGNLACLPHSIVECIGYPSRWQIPHYGGDTIYTWQAKQVGFEVEVIGGATAVCSSNPGDSSWLLSNVTIVERWKNFRSPKSNFYFYGYWRFCTIFWGAMGVFVFSKPYLRLLLIWILRLLFPQHVLKLFKSGISV